VRQPASHRPHRVLKDIRDILTCDMLPPKQ
jgi:hypothetical protein